MSIVFFALFLLRCIHIVVAARERVAVCITGQIARWLPEQQIPNLIDNNPDFFFSFFFLFQLKDDRHPVSYNKIGGVNRSEISNKKFEDGISRISNLYTRNNSELANLRFITPYTHEDWKKFYNFSSSVHLDRFTIFAKNNPMILNIYRNQADCLNDVTLKEQEHGWKYDYIIFTREDTYYFHPLNFTIPAEKLKLQLPDKTAAQRCDLISKDCLRWGGINMRVEIARRSDAMPIFGSRLAFYKQLFAIHQTFPNPEQFELHHLKGLHYHGCILPVQVLAMTVARADARKKEGVCFFEGDLANGDERCYPIELKEKILEMRCYDYPLKL